MFFSNWYQDPQEQRKQVSALVEYLISHHQECSWFSLEYFKNQKESEEQFQNSKTQSFRWATKLYRKFAARLRKKNNQLSSNNSDMLSTILKCGQFESVLLTISKYQDDIYLRLNHYPYQNFNAQTIVEDGIGMIYDYRYLAASSNKQLIFSSRENLELTANKYSNYWEMHELITLWFCLKGVDIQKDIGKIETHRIWSLNA